MTATNHVVTGALIACAIHNPVVALPLAVASHFVLDALPHFGLEEHTTKSFLIVLGIDMTVASSVLLFLLVNQPAYWLLIVACGIAAASPDLMWLPRFLKELRTGKMIKKPFDPITQFHHDIQWFERRSGLVIEFVWFGTGLMLLNAYIN